MDFEAEIIDITNLDDHQVINVGRPASKQKSANFGDGIELLMNEKRKNDGGSKNMGSDIDLADLNDLEAELNNLSEPSSDVRTTHVKSKSSLFNQALHGNASGSASNGGDSIKLNFRDDDEESVLGSNENDTVGRATADKTSFSENKTWDGFGKFNNVPINPDREMSDKPRLSAEEMLMEKFKILRKLEELERKGVKLTKKYSMESPLAEMKGEYEMIISEKEKSNSCKFQGRMLMAAITGLEFLNNRFDPFDIKLDGWAEQLNENIGDYDDIFAELHEKYKSKAKMAPELKLLFQLGGSGIMVHMTNTMFKSSMPGMDDIMRQNPELAQQFTQAAVNSMGQQNPGFGGFMSNFMPGGSGGSNSGGAGINFNNMPSGSANYMKPPAPMQTQQQKSERYAVPSNRPDLSRARDNDGINIQEQFEPVGREPAERSTKKQGQQSQQSQQSQGRAEMKGPSDIDDLLAGLKTKTINVQPTQQKERSSNQTQINNVMSNRNTPIEIPKPKRKQRSDKNTVSLDI